LSEEDEDEGKEKERVEETTKRFVPRSRPVKKQKDPQSISTEDRRLLLRKLFGGRTRSGR